MARDPSKLKVFALADGLVLLVEHPGEVLAARYGALIRALQALPSGA